MPLVISGRATTSAAGADAKSLAYIEYGGGDLYTCSSTIEGVCGVTEPSSGSLDSVVFSNECPNIVYNLQIIINSSSTDGSGRFAASISGLKLEIEPSWLAANPGYRLETSSNVRLAR